MFFLLNVMPPPHIFLKIIAPKPIINPINGLAWMYMMTICALEFVWEEHSETDTDTFGRYRGQNMRS